MTIAQERLAKGLCPRCGEEAAPYRLCFSHRAEEMIRRCLRNGVTAGAIDAVREGGRVTYGLTKAGEDKTAPWDFRAAFEGKAGWNDKRYKPRLGRIPVDVEAELIGIFTRLARPATIDEILAAWGKLRQERKHRTAAGDLAAIIAAERRRNERAAKRLTRAS